MERLAHTHPSKQRDADAAAVTEKVLVGKDKVVVAAFFLRFGIFAHPTQKFLECFA
ncbi:hypothetical protein IT6_03530 [Methylacidiphilum caldifontis]|uniref:hypothetical protein n=1 Tax=Methylacidiphilum caldifontis TaxID=2795386 RepID=UPI001A8C0F52|nr:hypothetical protein [Methylacidiphilum caldifontis]QSR89363.1 hypothetical protein IT6_03530 [Methylacidiphilum caldifontis]